MVLAGIHGPAWLAAPGMVLSLGWLVPALFRLNGDDKQAGPNRERDRGKEHTTHYEVGLTFDAGSINQLERPDDWGCKEQDGEIDESRRDHGSAGSCQGEGFAATTKQDEAEDQLRIHSGSVLGRPIRVEAEAEPERRVTATLTIRIRHTGGARISEHLEDESHVKDRQTF